MRRLVATVTAAAVTIGAVATQPATQVAAREGGAGWVAAMAAAVAGHPDVARAVRDLRERIEADRGISADEKALHHRTLNTLEAEKARIDDAEQRLAALVEEASQHPSEARRAEIVAEEQTLLSQIGGSREALRELAKAYEAKLTPHERAEAEVLIQKIRSGETSLDHVLSGGEDAGGWVLILVLYVLLVVIGAHG